MGVFALAANTLFADANLASVATYRAGGIGPSTEVRVVLSRPDEDARMFDTRVRAESTMMECKFSDIPDLLDGDTFDIDGSLYRIFSAPAKDMLRLIWKAQLELVA